MIVGTAGHIDHGKTSLVRTLTGIDTDRLKEEKSRGISIELGFAYLPAPDGQIVGFVDVPGHEKLVHTMLAGASGIDFVVLVVAADDGIMPQTREHLAIVDLLGIKRGLVALTKIDAVAEDRVAEVIREIDNTLADTKLAGAPVYPVSSITGQGIDDLKAVLFGEAAAIPRRPDDGRFRLAVDRCFALAGAGTIVTGTVLSGRVGVGDAVIVSPTGLSARVRSIHAQNRAAEEGRAGDRCALGLTGTEISKDAISRGNVVLDGALHAPTDRIDAELTVVRGEAKPVGQWMPVRLHHAAVSVPVRIVLLEDADVAPGTTALVQLVLEQKLAAAVGDRFVIRDVSAQRTIGGGRFLDLRAPARKRRTAERRAQLAALAMDDAGAALTALLDQAPYFVDFGMFARDRTLSAAYADTVARELGLVRLASGGTELALSASGWLKLREAVRATLETYHKDNPDLPGIGLERLRLQMAIKLPAPVFIVALRIMAKAGEISLDGAWVRLATHEGKLTDKDEALWAKIEPLLRGTERFRPPRVRDIAGILIVQETEVRRVLKLLGRMGKVDEVAHDHFFPRETVSEMVDICVDISAKTTDTNFTAAQLRDRLDNGRKVAIQILEFFDRHGVTLRKGDLRRPNPHRLDLFRKLGQEEGKSNVHKIGRDSSPVGRPGFKPGWGREPVLGGFDSHSLPPISGAPTSRGAR
jgi:selenocysteine-specific elongation factor